MHVYTHIQTTIQHSQKRTSNTHAHMHTNIHTDKPITIHSHMHLHNELRIFRNTVWREPKHIAFLDGVSHGGNLIGSGPVYLQRVCFVGDEAQGMMNMLAWSAVL